MTSRLWHTAGGTPALPAIRRPRSNNQMPALPAMACPFICVGSMFYALQLFRVSIAAVLEKLARACPQ